MLRVLQVVVSDHAASSHAPCARATQQSGRAAQRRSLAYQLCRVTREQQAFRRASGPRISTTLVVGGPL